MDRRLAIPMVQADAAAQVLEWKISGAFNLAVDPPITQRMADALGRVRSTSLIRHAPALLHRVARPAAAG